MAEIGGFDILFETGALRLCRLCHATKQEVISMDKYVFLRDVTPALIQDTMNLWYEKGYKL